MGSNSTASMVFCRTALASVLCVLAFVFAVEAKTAWYGPSSGFGSDVRAAKALPVDIPKVAHREPAPDPVPAAVFISVLTIFSFAWPAGTDTRLLRDTRNSDFPYAFCFSPAVFFRPPPVLF